METRAPFIVVGAFVLAAIVAAFGFVYWLNNSGGIGKRETYQVVFNGPVPGLLVGAAVLFNGIRVGEVTSLEFVPDRPRDVHATIAVLEHTPVRADTKVGLDFQGLTGVPVVALEGGERIDAPRVQGPLIAEKGAGQSMTQAARDALRKVDTVLSENSGPLHDAIGNIGTFAEGLARNTPRLDNIIAGLDRTMGSGAPARKATYDLSPASRFDAPIRPIKGTLSIAEPTAITALQTQRFLFAGDDAQDFPDAQWSDALPQLVQAKLLQSFENYDIAHPPFRPDAAPEGSSRLLLDLRQFEIITTPQPHAAIALSAKLLDSAGHLRAARVFHQEAPIETLAPGPAAKAFNAAFDALARELVLWTAGNS
ncbi:membrane integrity-associated transporter subunit PqiC [Bradyrhizobium sp. BRP22]|uniref:ABC-type transport auxiliary lipoprotein family protein n=1 Tax=Bradyrhizobium sp. BRP22 TaxID=2793821 RepID=UPI001CD288D0|nr:MlaD family protein [Bradyrhizobium sp. BRP22]MCA1451773.1 membrane integrity-associated transporter subunit PqiC [Bradyrhizobium sp. BRP22]